MNNQIEMLLELGDKSVLDENKVSIKLATLWEEKRVVLIFIRHFG